MPRLKAAPEIVAHTKGESTMKATKLASGLTLLATAFIFGGCPADEDATPKSSNVQCEGTLCTVTGELTEDVTFTEGNTYVLKGGVFVGNDTDAVTLTIEPGVTVFGDPSSLSFLVVRRNAKLVAEGTKEKPIVFTSGKEDGQRARGDWGGLIINGKAPLNVCGSGTTLCEAEGEGNTGKYGGDDPADSSGSLKYVRVEFGGQQITSDNELNGIAFQGVGSGTKVEYVQVHMSKDDGVEFFGGNVNAKYLVLTGVGDDSMDWTDGWQGKVQFGIIQQYDDDGDNGIEADNNGDNNTATPRSKPTLSNLTIIGSPNSSDSDLGMLLREGTGASIHNTIVTSFNEGCLSIDQEETFKGLGSELSIKNSIVHCTTGANYCDVVAVKAASTDDDKKKCTSEGIDMSRVSDFFANESTNQNTDPMIADPTNLETPDFSLKADSPAKSGGAKPADAFFTETAYIGAVGDAKWYEGWTTNIRK